MTVAFGDLIGSLGLRQPVGDAALKFPPLAIALEGNRAGAKDYVMKDSMARLIPVIERELRETDSRNARKMAEEAVYYMAFHDPLTGLANRYEFESKLIKILETVKSDSQAKYCLLYIDLDQFKVVTYLQNMMIVHYL